jgi:hypothetical protein
VIGAGFTGPEQATTRRLVRSEATIRACRVRIRFLRDGVCSV